MAENSFHGYGIVESVNIDFAFVEKEKEEYYDYQIIKQENVMLEGSDHSPVLLSIDS